ncbi:MAG: hypothetical protein NVSMB6_14980 [Burkholderiaceae bacterium]
MKIFRFRSATRDVQTDIDRIGPIVAAINAALASAGKEREALNLRVREACDLAAVAAGTGTDEYLTRDSNIERGLAGYERQLVAGEKRIEELDNQIKGLLSLSEVARGQFSRFIDKNL